MGKFNVDIRKTLEDILSMCKLYTQIQHKLKGSLSSGERKSLNIRLTQLDSRIRSYKSRILSRLRHSICEVYYHSDDEPSYRYKGIFVDMSEGEIRYYYREIYPILYGNTVTLDKINYLQTWDRISLNPRKQGTSNSRS